MTKPLIKHPPLQVYNHVISEAQSGVLSRNVFIDTSTCLLKFWKQRIVLL